jgi:hypothetical protein
MMETDSKPPDLARIAEVVRAACLQAAQQGYERAAADGLCDEGALEVALDTIRSLDLDRILRELKRLVR